MSNLRYYRTAELPDISLWLQDDAGTLVDYSTGYTFVFKLGRTPGAAATFTKTTGIEGAAGSGTEDSGAPNAIISFGVNELDDVEPGYYTWQLRATTTASGLDRVYQGVFVLDEVLL